MGISTAAKLGTSGEAFAALDARAAAWSDATWMLSAPPLITEGFWRAHAIAAASCAGWQLPACSTPPEPNAGLRLGHHFERVHGWLLRAQRTRVQLTLNTAIRDGARTLGELDCLYEDSDGAVVHREIAVKYYLGRTDSAAARDWWGPGKRDRLDLKLRHMVEHQTMLPQLAQQANAWPANLPFPERREAFVRGAFFKHPAHVHWPEFADASCERGFWCESEGWLKQGAARQRWVVLPKLLWLSAVHARALPPQAADVIAEAVERTREPLLVAAPDGEEGIARGFIVPRGWAEETP